jgi:hypothetical protein
MLLFKKIMKINKLLSPNQLDIIVHYVQILC